MHGVLAEVREHLVSPEVSAESDVLSRELQEVDLLRGVQRLESEPVLLVSLRVTHANDGGAHLTGRSPSPEAVLRTLVRLHDGVVLSHNEDVLVVVVVVVVVVVKRAK